jgi:MraZ protein
MDEKGRTSLPAKFREILSSRAEEQLVITQAWPDRCLSCQPPSLWAEFEKKVRAMPQFKPEVRRLMRVFVSPAQDCPVDKLGRVLIPPSLREYAGIKGEVVWAGAIDRIEIWNAETWKRMNDEMLAPTADDAFLKALGDLGL